MKSRVLVFPCGSEIGLEIHRSLNASTHFRLYGGSSTSDHGEYVYQDYIDNIPFVGDDDFTPKLNAIIAEYKIDYIIPAHDSVVLKLAEEKAADNLACEVITSDAKTCEITRSKLKTYQCLEGVVPLPRIYETAADVQPSDLPVFLKPDVGQGSKGTRLATSIQDISFYVSKDPTLLILENLPGKEYTIDCFTDKDGKLLFSEGRERQRISNGISVRSTYIEDERFSTLAQKINEKISFNGVWFFQVKENNDGEFILMEVASRIAGTMGLARAKGINLVLLSLFNAMGYKVEIFENTYNMTIDRALENKYKHDIQYKHVYLDFDDLVIFNGKVNPAIVAFVFQCVNNGIKVHLLTKHKDDLEQTLKRYRLSGLFDEVIWVGRDDAKHQSITEQEAIFIDDSFAERKAVYDTRKIPVFDSHMVEGLMEKF